MRQSRAQQLFRFALHVVLDAPNAHAFSLDYQVRSPSIPVIRLTDAAAVRHGHLANPPYVRTVNVTVDRNRRTKRRIRTPQFLIARIGHGSTPQIARAGMNQAESLRVISLRKSFQPAQAFFTNHRKRRRNQILYAPKKWPKLRRFSRKSTQTLRRPKHLVRISADSRPSQRTNLVDNLRRMCPAVSQIAALDHQVRRSVPQVRQHSLKRPKVTVNIRYDCGSHSCSYSFGNA